MDLFIKILDLSDETISHSAELSDAGVGGLSQPLCLNCRLTEEEEHLVVIGVLTFRDPKGTNKLWFWWTQRGTMSVIPVFLEHGGSFVLTTGRLRLIII